MLRGSNEAAGLDKDAAQRGHGDKDSPTDE